MRVLIAGGADTVTSAIIQKLSKEGARIYALTGGQKPENRYKKVYEQYNFSYENSCIKEIFESVNPDITIFTGAFDSNFRWVSGYSEAVRFGAGLYNCLNAFTLMGHGRFLFLSSDEVYNTNSDEYREIIREQRPLGSDRAERYAGAYKANALLNGENLCGMCRKTTGADVIALRIEELTFEPRNAAEALDLCSRMCIDLLNKNEIVLRGSDYSPVYISDMTEALYRVMNKESFKFGLYRLRSENTVSQQELAGQIKEAFGKNPNERQAIINNSLPDSENELHELNSELEIKSFKSAKECAASVIDTIKSSPEKFVQEGILQDKLSARVRRFIKKAFLVMLPFIENIIVFIPFFMLNNRTTGSAYLARLDCYLIYVLIFAIIYGQQQALFSAILSVAGYFFRQMYSRTGFEIILDYNTYVWIAQLVILGLSVGYLRDQLHLLKADKADEVSYLDSRLKNIEDINIINTKLKDELETQVVNQSDSLGRIFEITSTLDMDEPEEVFFHAAEVVSKLMDCREVAIYNVSNRSYARLISATSPNAKKLGNSIEYTKYTDMYNSLKHGDVYINRKLEKDYPLMAAAIMSGDEISSIIMLWNIAWEQMNLSQSNRLRVVSYLIQNAVLRANRYIEMLENERYIEGTRMLDSQAFKTLLDAYMRARKKGLADCSVIRINTEEKDLKAVSVELQKLFRASDYLGSLGDGNLYVLLANTSTEDAGFVTKRIEEAGYSFDMMTDDISGGAYGLE